MADEQAEQQGTEADAFADDAFVVAFSAACSECIAAARRLRPRLVSADLNAAHEYGRLAGEAMAKAGATKAEGNHYMRRILMAVLAEPQA